MRVERITLVYSMINNFIIASIKIISGFILGVNLVLVDGIQTFANFVTDGISLTGDKISRKRATKQYPFGFGKVEYLSDLFIGVLLFLLGIFIIIYTFATRSKIPTTIVFWLLGGLLILKMIAVFIMDIVGNKKNSQLLLSAMKEGRVDLLSNIGVIIIAILLYFSDKVPIFIYTELIGSIVIALLVIKSSMATIVDNSLLLIGEVEQDDEIIYEIEEVLHEFMEIEDQEILLIKYGSYYKLQLSLELDNSLTLKKIVNLENKIKIKIKSIKSLKIKHITIYVTNKID